MQDGILHINELGSARGGTEVVISNFVEKDITFSHYLIYEFESDSEFTKRFSASRAWSGLDEHEITSLLEQWNIKIVILHNFSTIALDMLLRVRANNAVTLIHFVHDYRLFYLGQGYNRVTQQRYHGTLDDYIIPFTLMRGQNREWRFDFLHVKKRRLKQLGSFDQIHVATQELKNLLIRNHVPKEKIRVNPLGTPNTALADARREPRQIAFVASFTRSKGPFVLLEAVRKLQLDFNLVMAGDGYLLASAKRYAARHALPVSFVGRLNESERTQLLRQSQVAVAPFFMDTFGLSIIEAMSQECPVIAFDEGGPKEIIQDSTNGFLCKVGNAEELAEKIATLLRQPELCREVGQKARQDVLNRFTFEAFLKRFHAYVHNS